MTASRLAFAISARSIIPADVFNRMVKLTQDDIKAMHKAGKHEAANQLADVLAERIALRSHYAR